MIDRWVMSPPSLLAVDLRVSISPIWNSECQMLELDLLFGVQGVRDGYKWSGSYRR